MWQELTPPPPPRCLPHIPIVVQAQWGAVLDAAAAAGLLDQPTIGELRDTAAGKGGAAAAAAAANGAAASSPVSAAGGIGGAGVPAFKSAMATALKEFFNSADAQEVAARWVRVLWTLSLRLLRLVIVLLSKLAWLSTWDCASKLCCR